MRPSSSNPRTLPPAASSRRTSGRRHSTARAVAGGGPSHLPEDQLGGLVVLARLADLDKGVLLGGLIAMADQLKGEQREQFIARCKARGDHLLASQAATNEKSAAAQAQNKEQEA